MGDEVQSDMSRTIDSVIDEGYLFIDSTWKKPELYDLIADPENGRDLVGLPEQHDRVERLKRTLDTLRLDSGEGG